MGERFRRKPTEITAVQWDGSRDAATKIALLGADFAVPFLEERPALLMAGKGGAQGAVNVPIGHWVAKAGDDDFYPIDPDVFAATYEPVEGSDG